MAKVVTKSRTSKKTDNIMAKEKLTKDRQYHSQREADKKTDNIMAKGKLTKRQTVIYKTLHIQLKIKQHELYTE